METENEPQIEGVKAHEFVCVGCGLVANRFAALPSGLCADHGEPILIVPNRW